MKFVRICSYLYGKLIAEHIYRGDNQAESLNRFRNEYPEHKQCILVANTYDTSDTKWNEYALRMIECGCCH